MTRRLWLGRSRCGVQLPRQFHSVAVAHAPRTKRIDANQEETRAGLRSHTVTIGAGNHWRVGHERSLKYTVQPCALPRRVPPDALLQDAEGAWRSGDGESDRRSAAHEHRFVPVPAVVALETFRNQLRGGCPDGSGLRGIGRRLLLGIAPENGVRPWGAAGCQG